MQHVYETNLAIVFHSVIAVVYILFTSEMLSAMIVRVFMVSVSSFFRPIVFFVCTKNLRIIRISKRQLVVYELVDAKYLFARFVTFLYCKFYMTYIKIVKGEI